MWRVRTTLELVAAAIASATRVEAQVTEFIVQTRALLAQLRHWRAGREKRP